MKTYNYESSSSITALLVSVSTIAQTSLSNDEINHERYWYLQSELRNRFVF